MGHARSGQAGGGADRPLQVARAQGVHHAGAQRVDLDQPLRARVAVGEDRLAQAVEPLGHQVEGLVPARLAELGFPLGAGADERPQEPLLAVDAVEVVGDLPAEEPDRDRVVGVAIHVGGAAVLDRHVHGAGVGTVVRAGRTDQGH